MSAFQGFFSIINIENLHLFEGLVLPNISIDFPNISFQPILRGITPIGYINK